jgi:hypothetical protein
MPMTVPVVGYTVTLVLVVDMVAEDLELVVVDMVAAEVDTLAAQVDMVAMVWMEVVVIFLLAVVTVLVSSLIARMIWTTNLTMPTKEHRWLSTFFVVGIILWLFKLCFFFLVMHFL